MRFDELTGAQACAAADRTYPAVRDAELAGGLPDWTLIGAGARRLYVVAADSVNPNTGAHLIGDWPLSRLRLLAGLGRWPLGAWRAICFEFPDRDPAVLQPFGREVSLRTTDRGPGR